MTLANLEKILLFLVVLFLPTQLGKHFWPQFSYIYSLKIDYLSPTLYFWDILAVGILVVWILQKPKINQLALNLLLVFLFTQALSLIGAGNIGAGLVRLEQYTVAGFFGVYLASVIPKSDIMSDRGNLDLRKIAVSSRKAGLLAMTNRKSIYLPLALGILGESLIAIIQFFKGSTIGLWILGERTFTISTPGIAKFDFYGYQFLRPYATFPHPNVLAGFMLVVTILLSFWGMRLWRMKMLWVSAFLAGTTIFLTMSRTVILAGFVVALVIRRQSIIVIIIITIITIIFSPILFTRFSSLLNFDNLTFARREELIGNAWQMFVKSPIFGVGLNNFIPVQAANLITGPSRFLQPVHNIILLPLAETGILGLLGLLGLIGYPIFKLYSYRLLLTALLPWAIILFLGMFDHYFLTLPQGYRLLFLVWGLSFSRFRYL